MSVRIQKRSFGFDVELESALFKARGFLFGAVAIGAFSACGGGGGSSSSVPVASSMPLSTPTLAPTPGPTSASSSFVVQPNPTSVPLPSAGGYVGTLNMPAVSGTGSVVVTVSLQPPTGVPAIQARTRASTYRLRRETSTATNRPLLYITLTPSQTITIQKVPGFTITLPQSVSISGDNIYVAQYGGVVLYPSGWSPILGPGTVSGSTVTAAPSKNTSNPITLVGGQAATFGVFSTGIASIQISVDAQPIVHTPSTVHLTVNAVDEYSNGIIGPGYPTIKLANDDTTGTVVLAAPSVNTPNASLSAAYNGHWISTGNASANITASIVGSSATGTFAISPQPVLATYLGGNTNNSCCLGIAPGPDGAIWYTNGNNSIGRISTSGSVTTFAAPSTNLPEAITAGPDGAIWFTDGEAGATDIGRLTTSGAYSTCTTNTLGQASSMIAGPDGNLWVAAQDGTIVRMVPGTCAQTIFGSQQQVVNFNNSLAVGSDGAIWFAQGSPGLGVQGYIGRITTSGVVTAYATPSTPTFSIPVSITAGPDGNLWYVDWGNNKIGRVTTSGVITEFGPSAYANGTGVEGVQGGLTTGPDGALWFSTGSGVGRMSLTGQMTNYPLGTNPYGLVLGSDHALWAQTFFGGQMLRIGI